MTDERLKEIQERLEKATPGPWRWEAGMMAEGSERTYAGYPQRVVANNPDPDDGTYPVLVAELYEGHEDEPPPNCTFITNAISDIPFLLAEIERQAKVIAGTCQVASEIRAILEGES